MKIIKILSNGHLFYQVSFKEYLELSKIEYFKGDENFDCFYFTFTSDYIYSPNYIF